MKARESKRATEWKREREEKEEERKLAEMCEWEIILNWILCTETTAADQTALCSFDEVNGDCFDLAWLKGDPLKFLVAGGVTADYLH